MSRLVNNKHKIVHISCGLPETQILECYLTVESLKCLAFFSIFI